MNGCVRPVVRSPHPTLAPQKQCTTPVGTPSHRTLSFRLEPWLFFAQDIDYVGLTQSGRLVIKLPKLFVEEVRTTGSGFALSDERHPWYNLGARLLDAGEKFRPSLRHPFPPPRATSPPHHAPPPRRRCAFKRLCFVDTRR